jgi:hypothetical protein
MSETKNSQPLTPTVSKVLPDCTLVELLYNGVEGTTALAVRDPEGHVAVVPHLDLRSGERLVPYSATNNLIATGCVLLPSTVGDFGDKGDLVEEVRAFIHRYVDLSPAFEEIAAHYVLLTWVYDAFNALGYLRFRGDYGTGKTRALLAVGSLVYKPFFASGASTVSPIFHVLDAFAGTLVLDEADFRFSDATADLTKILNNGNMAGLPVLRTMTNRHRELNPQAFRVYGPKLIAMRESFQDQALESRFLTEETGGRPLRQDVPIHLPNVVHAEALQLRNKLLAWRFRARGAIGPDTSRLLPNVSPRLNQTALALLSIVDDPGARDRIARELVGVEARVLDERASSPEATMLEALVEAFSAPGVSSVSVADLCRRYNEKSDSPFGSAVTPKWVGNFLRTRLRIPTRKSHGVYVVALDDRNRVDALAARYGLACAKPSLLDVPSDSEDARAAREYAQGA